jgi:hypothetical protein
MEKEPVHTDDEMLTQIAKDVLTPGVWFSLQSLRVSLSSGGVWLSQADVLNLFLFSNLSVTRVSRCRLLCPRHGPTNSHFN